MFTSFDLLIVAAMGLAALGVMSTVLMFLIRNRIARRVFMYVSVALALYLAHAGLYISGGAFLGQAAVSFAVIAGCVAVVVLDVLSKKNEKLFTLARILTAVAVVTGFANALLF